LAGLENAGVEAMVRARIAAQDDPSKPKPEGPGSLDKDYIKARIGEIKPLMKECYEMGLARKPDLAGKLLVKFSIVADPDVGGLVERAEILKGQGGGDIDDPGVHECVRETGKSIIFD